MSGDLKPQDSKRNTGLIIVIIIAVIIIAALVGVIVVILGKNNAESKDTVEKRSVVITEDNIDQIADEIAKEEVDPSVPLSYTATMTTTWNFDNGDAVSEDAYVKNSTDNTTAVYFDLIRNDTNEVILSSPVIPLGEELRGIKLDKHLDAGSYECTLIYYLIDDDQNVLTTLNMWVMVNIKE